MKVVIFYSSIGNGHISAARAVEKRILQRDPASKVVLEDIRAFLNPAWRALDERLYWFIAENLPLSFDALFAAFSHKGARAPSLSNLPNDFPVERVVEYLETAAPDVVISTYYGAAQLLGSLRERGWLRQMAIGWVHTDYFESYFPRISNRIDRTFVAHPELRRKWIEAGVAEDKVVATGMPVDVSDDDRRALRGELKKFGLADNILTILIVSGRNGVGDLSAMIQSLAAGAPKPVQIVAVCGTNAARREQLASHAARLPASASLTPLGVVPHEDLVRLMGAADLLVTKPGGLTPSEAFAMGAPTIVLDVISGHERENAAMFARCGLAKISRGPASLGEDARALLNDGDALAKMRAAQAAYRQSLALDRIVDFALEKRVAVEDDPPDFGRENGTTAARVEATLAEIDRDAPADLELLLSYATARTPQRIVTENPFGHIAIRIGPNIYSANHLARRDKDPTFLQHISLADYLYGATPPSASQQHTATYGMTYGREVLALRVTGITPVQLMAMRDEVALIEGGYRRGDLVWDRASLNCADIVQRILSAGGWTLKTPNCRLGAPTMPLDVFEAARDAFASDAALSTRLIAYRQLPGTRADYRYSRFPVSLYQPLRSLSNALRDGRVDPLEADVTRQVTGLDGDRRLFVDALVPRASEGASTGALPSIERAMRTDLSNLFRARVGDPTRRAVQGLTRRELNELTASLQEILKRAVVSAEQLGLSGADRLREACDQAFAIEIRAGAALRPAPRDETSLPPLRDLAPIHGADAAALARTSADGRLSR